MAKHSTPVPRHRIPKVMPICPKCQRGMNIVMSQAYADGYHRRHICDMDKGGCGHSFYTLASYDDGTFTASLRPYTDRELSEFEEAQRLQWWEEELVHGVVDIPEDPFIHRLRRAIATQEGDRTPQQTFMADLFETMKTEVMEMDKNVTR